MGWYKFILRIKIAYVFFFKITQLSQAILLTKLKPRLGNKKYDSGFNVKVIGPIKNELLLLLLLRGKLARAGSTSSGGW